MCGIAGIHRRGTKQVRLINRLADNLFLEIENRGTHATGMASLSTDGLLCVERRVERARRFIETRQKLRPSTKTALFHTRFATTGEKDNPRDAHPQTSGRVTAIHNGTIYNADELFRTFKLPRAAQVDSEIVPALIDYSGWSETKDALSLLRGGAALAIVSTEHPDEVILARTRQYPLEIFVTTDLVIWASTRTAIALAWKRTYGKALPRTGKWVKLADYSMVRVNGSIGEPEPWDPPAIPRRTDRYEPPVVYSNLDDLDLFTDFEERAIKDMMRAGLSRFTAEGIVLNWQDDFEVYEAEELEAM